MSYEERVNKVANSIIFSLERFQDVFIGSSVALVAVACAIPEGFAIYESTGQLWLAIAMVMVAVGVSHMAVYREDKWGWILMGIQILIAEVIIFTAGHYIGMAYPLVTIVGSVTFAFSIEENKKKKISVAERQKELEAEEKQRQEDAERERKEFDAQLEKERQENRERIEKERQEFEHRLEQERLDRQATRDAKLLRAQKKYGVAPTVAQGVASNSDQSSATVASNTQNGIDATVDARREELLKILQDLDTPDQINKTEIGRMLGVTRYTIQRDLKYFKDNGIVSLNGHVEVNRE